MLKSTCLLQLYLLEDKLTSSQGMLSLSELISFLYLPGDKLTTPPEQEASQQVFNAGGTLNTVVSREAQLGRLPCLHQL